MAEGQSIDNIPAIIGNSGEYYNPNYDPYVPYYPPYYPPEVIYYPYPALTECPSELQPLLQELTEIKNLLKQILDKQGES